MKRCSVIHSLKSLPDPKSERELRILCTRIQQEEIRNEIEENEFQDIKNAVHKIKPTQPVSKKQRDQSKVELILTQHRFCVYALGR